MKTIFSRFFALFAAVIVLCLLILGSSFRVLLKDYLEDEKRESLHNNAETLANLAAAYEGTGRLDAQWSDFHIAFTSAALVADADAMICSPEGEIFICACQQINCIHKDKIVDTDRMGQIAEKGELFWEGNIADIYEQDHYIEAMSIRSQDADEVVGILIVATPHRQIGGVVMQSTLLLLYVSVIVLAVAMIAVYILSQRQSGSIQQVARAAVRLGHGELDTRVPVCSKNTIEVNELAAAFNTMAESLSQAERQRQEFVANVSHELKTPMTTISGFLDGMLDGTIPQQQHRHYMQLVSDEVRRLSRLVRNMLEISRLQSQGISEDKKRRFDLCEVIGQVLISFERRVNGKHLFMDVQLPDRSIWVKADQDSIMQVLYNLVDNGVKFCPEGGRLSIWLTTEGSKAKVTVQNTGTTIPPEDLPLLFDRFHKTDKSRSADREGVGLGLYIVKTILGGHGEDISVTSHDGVTTFVFSLPLVR